MFEFDLSTLHMFWRYSHIVAGFIGLAAFWIPVFAKKGSTLHIRSGRVFAICGYYVGVTALVACIWAVVSPRSFLMSLGMPEAAATRPQTMADIRMFFSILLYLAAAILTGLTLGIRVLRTRKMPGRLSRRWLRSMYVVYGCISVSLLAFGLWHIPSAGFGSGYLICVILGFLGLQDMRDSLKFMTQSPPTPMAWWYKHMECMVGCGIGFHTAFFVFGFSRLIPEGILDGPFRLIPWVLPSAIGIPVMVKWINYYKRRFETPEPAGPLVRSERAEPRAG